MSHSTAQRMGAQPKSATGPKAATQAMASWWRSVRHAPHRLNLALQGGGAHGAFSWGVLDALLQREDTPRTRDEIEARRVELAFSTHVTREMRMFAHAWAFARPGRLTKGRLERRLRQMRFHLIDTSDLGSLQRTETERLACGPFLERLHAQGRERGAAWLTVPAADLGCRSTVDIEALSG